MVDIFVSLMGDVYVTRKRLEECGRLGMMNLLRM